MRFLLIEHILQKICEIFRRSKQTSMEDLRKMLVEFDKTDDILQFAHVVPKYEEEGLLERSFSKWCTDGNKSDVLEKAIIQF